MSSSTESSETVIRPLIVRLRDLDAVRAVCRRHGWEFRAGQTSYRCLASAAEENHCAHAIGIPGCRYEIGLISDGGYFKPVWDAAPVGGLDVILGSQALPLWRGYVVEIVHRTAARHNHVVSSHTDRAGTLRVRSPSRPLRTALTCA